ncbi:unnamed protein product [Effrenium voratum]|nr:unnamed protein product [Effrenium voratum]
MPLPMAVTATVLRRSEGKLGRAASACMQGYRSHFEDFHVCDQMAGLVGVFDGHLGDEAAAFCAERLPLHLAKAATACEWEQAFKACDAELRARLPETDAGTTATIVRVKENCSQDSLELLVGSCGDSRALLWQKESNTLISTRDHRPDDPEERRRIEAAGGEVTKDDPPRVDGLLSCSRALGAFELKQQQLPPEDQKVSCMPDMYNWHAKRGDWLILACDGIWDCLSNQQVVDKVCRGTNGKDLGKTVEELLQLCIRREADDNLTLVAIELGAVEPKDDTVTMNAGDFLKARREEVPRYNAFALRFGYCIEKNTQVSNTRESKANRFIGPPSLDALEKRLRARGTETEEKIQTRLRNAKSELEFYEQNADMFNGRLINDDLGLATRRLQNMMRQWYPQLVHVVEVTGNPADHLQAIREHLSAMKGHKAPAEIQILGAGNDMPTAAAVSAALQREGHRLVALETSTQAAEASSKGKGKGKKGKRRTSSVLCFPRLSRLLRSGFFGWAGCSSRKESAPYWLLIKPPENDLEQSKAELSAAAMFRRRDDAKPEVLVESNGASLPLAPQAQLGTCVVDRHRVLQVCLGRDHGVLLSDAGVAFTWGDNRYGQLGRTPVLKEEFGRPFPVLGLSGYEVTQVSAGHHHCLALVAPGLVWAWGRNKQGQLGIGDFRDQTQPVKVCHPPIAEGMDSLQLGANKGGAIVTVNAGCDSSLAAAGNADVWQWGEISDGFAVPVNNPDKSKKSGLSVVKSRPYCVFDKAAFRSQMRSGRISVSSTGCKVLHQDTFTDKVRAETLVQGVQDFQSSINQDRKALMELEKELEVKKVDEGPTGEELETLQDTVGQLERDIMLIQRDIDAFVQSLESCDLRQAHNRKQLQQLQQQGTSLRDRQDEVSLRIFMAPKAGAERRSLSQVEEFVQANKNTRMTLLDQRAETDKEKQSILAQLADRRKQRERFQRRLEIVKDLSKSNKVNQSGASDMLVKVLHQQCLEVQEYFMRRQTLSTEQAGDFLTAMKVRDVDNAFLDQVEQKMKDVVESVGGDQNRVEQARLVNEVLLDIVNLRRTWCDMLEDRWAQDGLDLSCFFEGSQKPKAAMVADGFDQEEPQASLQTPQLPSLGFGMRSPDDAMAQGVSNPFTLM